jgi:hypothetical protein
MPVREKRKFFLVPVLLVVSVPLTTQAIADTSDQSKRQVA